MASEPPLFLTLHCYRTVKYLRVVLDDKPNWSARIKTTLNAVFFYWVARTIFGKTWGLNPRVILWLCTVVIRFSLVRLPLEKHWNKCKDSPVLTSWAHPPLLLYRCFSIYPPFILAEAEARRASYRIWRNVWRSFSDL